MAQVVGVAYDTTGLSMYMLVRDATGAMYRGDTGVFESYSTANLTNARYGSQTQTEQGTASRFYTFAFPTAAAVVLGTYMVAIYVRLGANPAETDTLVTAGTVWWSGTAIETPQSANIAAIQVATGSGNLITKVADSGTLTTGTNTSGSYTDTFTKDAVYWVTAPVTPAVGGFGLRQNLTFNLPLNDVPVNIYLWAYFTSGGSRVVDVYALNAITGVYDKITQASTALQNRTTELLYQFVLPRDYGDSSGGAFNVVTLELRSTSVTTTDRLRVDQILVTAVDTTLPTTSIPPTVADIAAGVLSAAQLAPIWSNMTMAGGTTQTAGDIYAGVAAVKVKTDFSLKGQ